METTNQDKTLATKRYDLNGAQIVWCYVGCNDGSEILFVYTAQS